MLSVAFAFLLIETALRLAGIDYADFFMADPHRGFAHRPGASGWWRKEGKAFVRINSDGMRDREHVLEKRAGVVRLAVLGDSYAEAFQVPAERAFWAVMERRLSGCPALSGRRIEALNFGVSGYGTAQHLITLRSHVWKYDPDVVVLSITTGNDIRNNSRALEGNATVYPFFTLRGSRLVEDNSFKDSDWYRGMTGWKWRLFAFGLRHSRALQVVWEARTKPSATRPAVGKSKGTFSELGLDDDIYRTPGSPEWEDAWSVTEALMDSMGDEVRSRGKKFLAVTLTNGIQVHPSAVVQREFRERLRVPDLLYPDRRIAAAGMRDGYPVLTLVRSFDSYARANRIFLHGFDGRGDGHWNEIGHELAGRTIASAVCDLMGAGPPRPAAELRHAR